MGDPLSTIKPAVRNLQAYTLKHFRAAVKINQNENPFDMPEAVKRAVHQAVSRTAWSRYPDFVPASLISRLADFSHWKEDGVLVGNGSNELIEALMVVVVERGKRVVLPQPTFTLYGMFARILGGACRDVPLKPDLEFDGPGLLREARQADLTILCSPNNPTGGVLDRGDLEKILRQAAGLVVVDEAYHEFSRQSVVGLLERFENLVVLRTFSKAMSMAGLRVGYLLGRPELVEQVAKAKLPYNLNVFSMAAASAALEHFDLLKPQIERVIAERERLWEGLSRISRGGALSVSGQFHCLSPGCGPGRGLQGPLRGGHFGARRQPLSHAAAVSPGERGVARGKRSLPGGLEADHAGAGSGHPRGADIRRRPDRLT